MSYFIDIHTHRLNNLLGNYIRIQNKLLHERSGLSGQYISVGWHPWFLNQHSFEEMKAILHDEIQSGKVIAIGECGLDRVCKTDFDLQLKIFREHIFAAKESSKPLIIHCVRAYSDLLGIIKKEKLQKNFIVHDYRGNQQQTKELMKFNCWFSFGKSLISANTNLISTLQSIPSSRIFLETDNSDQAIEKIYIQASKILSIEIEELKLIIETNFRNCFGDKTIGQKEA